MGTLGCKYCNCNKDKIEDPSDEMKIQNNSPVDFKNENNNKEENNKEQNNLLNKNEDLNSNINVQINDNKDKNNNQTPIIDISELNHQIYTNSNNLVDNTYNIKPIFESKQILQKDTFNNNVDNNYYDNNINNNIDNNSFNNQNHNNFVVEENIPQNIKENNLLQHNNKEIFIIENNNNTPKKNKNELTESKESRLSILNTKDAKDKIKKYKIDRIQFGLEKEDKENLNKEQQKLYKEAENNLQKFNPPQENEMKQLQNIMSNILFKLKNIFNNVDLNSNRDDIKYILLNGNLKKMINFEINSYNTKMYSERFCVLFPKMLKYYKSKVQFLKNLSPACILPINQISAVNIAKPKKGSKKPYHLIICNKLGIKKNYNKNIFLNLFDSNEINDYINSPDLNESLLIFTSDDEKDIYKWYIVIQYLIEFSKTK